MSKSIEERVDALLMVGTKEPKKWATVHGYFEPRQMLEAPICGECTLQDEWQLLRDHHLQETTFLFEIIDELVKRLNRCPQCAYNTLVPNEGCLVCPTCGYSKG